MNKCQDARSDSKDAQFLSRILAQLGDHVFAWDSQGRVVYANRNPDKPGSLNSGGGLDETSVRLAPPLGLFAPQLAQVMESRTALTGSFSHPSPEGATRHYEYILTPVLDARGEVDFIGGVSRDVTQREHAEAAWQESERLFSLLFNSIDQACCVMEIVEDEAGDAVDFRAVKANPAFERQTGIREVVGKTQKEVLPDLETHWPEAWLRVARTGRAEHLVGKSPALGRWFDASVLPLQGAGSRCIALLFYDITERMQVERSLKEADRRKDEFLAILAHELRNPLAAIRTGLDIVSLCRRDAHLLQQAVGTINRQSQQLVRLVDDLLEVSHISQGKTRLNPFQVALTEVIQNAVEALDPVIREAGQTLTLGLPEEDILLRADPHRLTQVFSNLLDNALKYNREGGRIELSAWREGDTAVIAVRDTGIGIAREKQQQIFELFAQIERPQVRGYIGLGLGLTLVKSLLEMHGGSISVQSEGEGQGSTFTVKLPALPAVLPAQDGREDGWKEAHGQPDREPAAEATPRVLVVDDNKDAAQMLTALARLFGCEVETAYCGLDAVELASSFRPELILMDLGMPEMDGFAAAAHIRAQSWGRQIKIVALSGWSQDEDRRRTQQAGFSAHLVKPVETQVLRELLFSLK